MKSLPIPDYQGTKEGYVAPRNEREHKLSIIWERARFKTYWYE